MMSRTSRPGSISRAPLIAALLAVLVGLGGLLFVLSQGPQPTVGLVGSASNVGGPFSLVDSEGREVTERDFLGTPFIVYFGFTFCPDACPTQLQILAAALDQLGEKGRAVKVLFVTIDPDRDTPSVVGRYARAFGPQILGLTGSPEQVAQAARAYGVFFQKVPLADNPGEYTMDHTTAVYLMNAKGKLQSIFVPNQPPEDIAATIAKLL
jgi:protein SCO1/2